MSDDPEEEFRAHCQLEDQLINQRLGWMLASEALLFAGYGAALTAFDDPTPGQLLKVTRPFFLVGVAVAVLTSLGVAAAVLANLHYARKLHGKYPGQHIELGRWTPATVVGWLVAFLLPVVFALGWGLLRCATV